MYVKSPQTIEIDDVLLNLCRFFFGISKHQLESRGATAATALGVAGRADRAEGLPAASDTNAVAFRFDF
eukprot:5684871-Amphidinium_carterae.1